MHGNHPPDYNDTSAYYTGCPFLSHKLTLLTVETPHIASSLPPPRNPLTSQQSMKISEAQKLSNIKPGIRTTENGYNNSTQQFKARRLDGGGVQWWSTTINVEINEEREWLYGWGDVSGWYMQTLS